MLSIKYINHDGDEQIHGDFDTTSVTGDERGLRVVTGHRNDGYSVTFFQYEKDIPGAKTAPRLYVMNEAGATIAQYPMGANSVAGHGKPGGSRPARK